ncbi:thioredoxin family protein [Flavobacterium cyanobacteriorum]|uniref:Thioredoxin family protein n=1 Tax=Flavobacterium cyanobacteriorum TaxID=2022802 RepID=A0A255ZS62_9FLAO|nr:thioredoxin family protein [Flavobacterium cyanobacteriorum]OYQ43560.1 thioredoxin family protein [Flavobacterium cyanobacteriorum]
MDSLIENSLNNSYTYTEYRNHISHLLIDGLSTGHTQSEDLTHYSTLNEVRMNRLDKTIIITPEVKSKLEGLKQEHILLVLSEGWCGDAAQIMPVINKMAEATDKLELKIVLRDDNDALMNEYLTNGSRSIPKLVLVDKDTLTARGSWGPRPHGAAKLIMDYKEKYGVIDQEAKTELQKWYLHDKGESTMEEIALLLQNADNVIVAG